MTVGLSIAVIIVVLLMVTLGRWPHEVGVDSDPLAGETEGVGAMAAVDANTTEAEDAA